MRRTGLVATIALFVLLANRQARAQADSVTTMKLTDAQVSALALSVGSGSPPPACVDALKQAAATARTTNSASTLQSLISFDRGQICPTWLLLSSDQYRAAVQEAQAQAKNALPSQVEQLALKQFKAMSQQNGASVGTSGGTNLTSKGMASKVLSLATQYGALTQSTSGNTTTASGSIGGVPAALLNRGLLTDCAVKIFALTPCADHKVFDYLTRISYSISFDTSPSDSTATATATGSSSGTAQQVSTTSTSRSISAVSVKWVAWQLPPKQADVTNASTTVAKSAQANTFATAAKAMQLVQDTAPTFLSWYKATGAQLLADAQADATDEILLKDWKNLGTSFAVALGIAQDITPDAAVSDPALQNGRNLAQAVTAYIGEEETTGNLIARAPVLSFEYDDNRPASAPSNSVFRAIYQANSKAVTVTVNGAFSIYNTPQNNVPGAGRLRDVQFATEVAHDIPLKLLSSTATIFTASAAFYDQYQSSPSILNVTPGAPVGGVTFVNLPSTATQVYGTTGNIAIGQLKLTAGSGSSVTVPLSVTYSNRTELITKPTWKAQIGISYDFDSLFSSSK